MKYLPKICLILLLLMACQPTVKQSVNSTKNNLVRGYIVTHVSGLQHQQIENPSVVGSKDIYMPLTQGVSHNSLLGGGRVFPDNDNAGALQQRITEPIQGIGRMPSNCFRAPEPDNGNLPCLLQSDID